jgi:hypothetical protein
VACTPRHVSTQQHVTGYKSLLGSSYPRDPARFVHRANVPWFDGASSSQMHHQSVMNSVDQDKEFIPQSVSQSVSAVRFRTGVVMSRLDYATTYSPFSPPCLSRPVLCLVVLGNSVGSVGPSPLPCLVGHLAPSLAIVYMYRSCG